MGVTTTLFGVLTWMQDVTLGIMSTPIEYYHCTLLHESECNTARYFMSVRLYYHEPKASET